MEPATALIKELLQPRAYEHAVARLQLRETHISWVILTGTYAYKIKKPVHFDFLDASTLERRRELCMEEVRLNRRLAKALYLDVVPITRSEGAVHVGGTGTAVEYAVRMRQFSSADELPALLEADLAGAEQIAALGELLAQFHREAAVAPSRRTPEMTERLYDAIIGNLAELVETASPSLPQVHSLVDWIHRNADALELSFELRERMGFVRECHGDLHLANIVRWQGRLVPFDCLEFDPALRWIDVMADLAFLVMDLISHERRDLAAVLLSRYLEVSGDYAGMRVLPFCAVHRALVRAKVDALVVEHTPSRAASYRARLERRIRAATDWTQATAPILILMHGVSGSGKSWLSSQLIPALNAIRIRSDLERKRVAGIDTQAAAVAPFGTGIYSSEFGHRTYARLLECAEHCLSAGFNVIVDATFLDRDDRALFQRLAARSNVPCFIIACEADPQTLAARVRERSTRGTDASDATTAVLDAQLRETEPFAADEQEYVIAIDTRSTDAADQVARMIERRVIY